jgi:DNA-binding winged helix-turn-helix (wHTH) protein
MPVFGSFQLDTVAHRLVRDGQEIHLRPKAFLLLALLLEAAPRIVPKREIHDRLWPRGVVADATLVALVKELRRALADTDRRAPIIRTVHRVGYAFNTPVSKPAARPAVHWLTANDLERLPLVDGENVIGRDPQTNLLLDYATVSRRHARISVSDGRAVIEDLGSKNGTSVTGRTVVEPAELRDGDRIGFGKVVLTYRHSAAGMPTVTEVSRLRVVRPGS